MDDDIAESCGCMTAEWFEDQLLDFMYTFENDASGKFIARANDLSKRYGKTGEDFVSELIAFVTNQKRTRVDRAMLDLFEQQVLHKAVQTSKEEPFNTSHTRIAFSERNENSWVEESDVADNSTADFSSENVTLSDKYASFTPIRNSVSDAAYQNRKDSGKVVAKYTGKKFVDKTNDATRSGTARKVVVEKTCTDDSKNLLQFGAEKDAEQVEELISRVQSLVDVIKRENEALFDDEQMDSTVTKSTVLCGFILNGTEERLDSLNCALQCVDENGTIISLDLTNLETYSLFPGKVVALRGSFAGEAFVPYEIFEPKQLQAAPLNKQTNAGLLRVWCACGPFTSPKTLSYEQLCDLIELAKKERPDVLILIGPFIDRTSPAVKSSQCCFAYDELMDMLLAKIDNVLTDTDIQVLVIPNGKKDAALRPNFPTPPFSSLKQRKSQLSKNMMLLPDPAVVQIAGVEFAVSASEIIQHLGKEEINRSNGTENQDRMSRLVGELFRQRSLYPLYPASEEVTFRLCEAIKRTSLSRIPHVIILPSVLAPTIKENLLAPKPLEWSKINVLQVVADTVFVNTNVLARGSSGTFMKLNVDLGAIPADTMSVADFCEVQIIRL